jgi:hypothetical protein
MVGAFVNTCNHRAAVRGTEAIYGHELAILQGAITQGVLVKSFNCVSAATSVLGSGNIAQKPDDLETSLPKEGFKQHGPEEGSSCKP